MRNRWERRRSAGQKLKPETQNSRRGTGRFRRGERNSCAGDVELFGLGENSDSSIGILLDDVDLESGAGGPAGRRTVDCGGTSSGGNILLQNDVGGRVYLLQDWMGLIFFGGRCDKTDVVSQGKGKAGRVGGYGSPSDILTLSARIPDGTLGRDNDGSGPGVDGEKGERGEDREGTHCLGWKAWSWKRGKEKGR